MDNLENLEAKEQNSSLDAWVKANRLRLVDPDEFSCPKALQVYLKLKGCDVSLWGYEKGTKGVESLFRQLKSYRSVLYLTEKKSNGDEEELIRCVSTMRVKFINDTAEGERILLEERKNKSGQIVHYAPSVRLKSGESPFSAAERLLFELTGVHAHRGNQEIRAAPKPSDQVDSKMDQLRRNSLSMKGISYEPLQYENPTEYQSLSSSTYPTLTTIYRINVLTLRLSQSIENPSESVIAYALRNGKTLVWASPEIAKLAFSHIELAGVSQAKEREFVDSHSHVKDVQDWYTRARNWNLNDESTLQDERGNHTLAHLAHSQRYNGPASVTATSKVHMESVLVDLMEKAWDYIERKRNEKALTFLETTNWIQSTAANGIAIAKNALPQALGSPVSPERSLEDADSAVEAADKGNFLGLFSRLPSRSLTTGTKFQSKTMVSSYFQKRAFDMQMEMVFRAVSFSKTGMLLPLAECAWFAKIQNRFESLGARDSSRRRSINLTGESLHLFRRWLLEAGLGPTYGDDTARKLLEEALVGKCELLIDPKTKSLERTVRTAKVLIYDKLNSTSPSNGQQHSSNILEVPPHIARRLVLQVVQKEDRKRISPLNESHLDISTEFLTVLNKKARMNEYMLEVVEKIIRDNFHTSITRSSRNEPEDCQPQIKSLYMLEPKIETNMSPTYPGLKSKYYLHQFWVRLTGIPRSENFWTKQGPQTKPRVYYWMWVDGIETDIFDNKTRMLEFFANQKTCEENMNNFVQSHYQRSSNSLLGGLSSRVWLNEKTIEQTYRKLFGRQLEQGCRSNDPNLVYFATERLWKIDKSEKSTIILKSLSVALDTSSWKSASALLDLYVKMGKESTQAPLTYFNNVLIIGSLINAQDKVIEMKEALVQQKVEKYSASCFCILPAVKLGRADILRLLLQMTPHFVNGPFFPSISKHIRQDSTSFSQRFSNRSSRRSLLIPRECPLWEDYNRTLQVFGLSNEAVDLVDLNGLGIRAFVPGYVDPSSEKRGRSGYSKVLTGFFSSLLARVSKLKSVKKVAAMSHVDDDQRITVFGWEVLLETICPAEARKKKTPLNARATEVLGVALSFCPPDEPFYRDFLEMYLVSIVSVCWNDNTIFGYELESKRMIISFLEYCRFPFHTALIMTQILKRLRKGSTYYGSELNVLYKWMHIQCVEMLNFCTSQEEANAILFEQIRVEPEITTASHFWSKAKKGGGDTEARENQDTSETSALFLAVSCRVYNVVASKWFQGTNENKLWFYEWHRMDKFPSIYEKKAFTYFGTLVVTVTILAELIIMLPIWCIAPFSISLSTWRDQLAINSAYFKFLSHTLLHFVFVAILFLFAMERSPVSALHLDQEPIPFSTLETILYIWVLGLVAAEFQAMYFDPINYMRSAVNLIDIIFLACFVAAFAFRLHSISQYEKFQAAGGNSNYDNVTSDEAGWFVHGAEWTPFGAGSSSDVFLSFGTLFAVYRLVHLSSYHPRLGPLYQSIKKMGMDILLFSFLLLTLLFGNSLATAFILRRYAVPESGLYIQMPGQEETMNAGLMSVAVLLGTIMFSGEIPDNVVALSSTDENLFYTLIVFHLWTIVIVLLSLLLAMMNRTYESTQDAAQVVYLNGRMDLINDYACLPVVPPPFNVITIPFEVLALLVNHIRYGNSRAVYFQHDRRKSENGIIGALTPFLSSDDSVSDQLRDEQKNKRKYQINHSMRKIRNTVLRKYFTVAREELKMPKPQTLLEEEYKKGTQILEQSSGIKSPTATARVKSPKAKGRECASEGFVKLSKANNKKSKESKESRSKSTEIPTTWIQGNMMSPSVAEYLKAAAKVRQQESQQQNM